VYEESERRGVVTAEVYLMAKPEFLPGFGRFFLNEGVHKDSSGNIAS
jgi:hypothetical protein